MLRKYINGFIANRYILVEFGLTAVVMILAYINGMFEISFLKYLIYALTIAVIGVVALYFKDRITLGSVVDGIKKQNEFKQSILLGFIFFLEDRLVAYRPGSVVEDDYSRVSDATLLVGKKGKRIVQLTIDGKTYDAQVSTAQQAERLAAFLKRKNPNIKLHDLKTKGSGAWSAIDLVPAEKAMLAQ